MTPKARRPGRPGGADRFRARKRFGQHFLQPAWIEKLIAAIAPRPDDVFVEIGPGQGALTMPLAQRARRLIAIEIDRDLAASLRKQAPANLSVVNADYLDTDLRALVLPDRHVRLAGNLPYNVGSPILLKLLREADEGRFLSDATVMLQREVANRLVARPGTREYGVLSILTQLRAEVRATLELPPQAFRPVPNVSSSVVRLTFCPPVVSSDDRVFTLVVKTIFQQRRKTLLNATKPLAAKAGVPAAEILARAGIDSGRRPETLDLAELARLAEVFTSTDIRAVL